MLSYLAIAVGGALGSVLRFLCSGLVANYMGETFPWGTLAVNVSGSFVIGLFATLTGTEGHWLVSPGVRQFFMLGVCGGYTTFSSFSLQTLELMQNKEWLQAGLNSILSVILCLVGVWLGHVLAVVVNNKGGG